MAFAQCPPVGTNQFIKSAVSSPVRSLRVHPILSVSRRARSWREPGQRVVCMVDPSLHLPQKLSVIVDSFAAVPDVKMRYQQLLFYARKLPDVDPALKTDENRVRGCTSVVHVKVTLDNEGKISMLADSDAQLTKGLVAMLVNGLTGCTPEEVLAVDPEFINASGLSVSLTPSRTNGFMNMIAKIKRDVLKLVGETSTKAPSVEESISVGSENGTSQERPIYHSILEKLQILNPQQVEVTDHSSRHVNHQSLHRVRTESHFAVRIVSDAFENLSLIQRHRLIFKILSEEVEQTHALNIDAKTPAEAGIVKAKAN